MSTYYVLIVEKLNNKVVKLLFFDNDKAQHEAWLSMYNEFDLDYNVQKYNSFE